MQKFVVTIGREFGCNASEAGRKLASKLGVKFYEKELVERAAIYEGKDESSIFDLDKKKSSKDLMHHYINEFGYGVSSAYFNSNAIEAQSFVIRDIANKESCVMFGRCSDHFLADYDNVLNVFLYAPFEFRLKHVQSAYNLPQKQASMLIKKIDKLRHRWYKYVTGTNRGERTNRHIMINMEQFSTDDAVDLIYTAAQKRFNIS